jgi:hypothetical protein
MTRRCDFACAAVSGASAEQKSPAARCKTAHVAFRLPRTQDAWITAQEKEVTSQLRTCLDRKDVPPDQMRIRPGLLKFRDEVLQTVPGVVRTHACTRSRRAD